MKLHRLFILALAAWAGTWIYKLQYVSSDSSNSSGRSLYSDITGSGSLAQTVRASNNNRSSRADPPSYGSKSFPPSSKSEGSNAVEDIAPDDMDLLQAAAKGDQNLVERRLSLHVKINSRDAARRTPLMYATWNGDDNVANRLLAAGANPLLKDRQGNNAFDYAASRGLTDSLQFLLSRTHTNDDQHYMEYAAIMQAVYAGDPAKLPEGTGKLAAINHINPEGQAPLHIAAGNGSIALMQALIHRGAQIDITNDNRQTPLHWAAWNNQAQAVRLLLSQGANMALADFAGNTPLILATQNNATEAAQMLLSNGADRYTANKDGKTAAIIAEDNGFTALANILK